MTLFINGLGPPGQEVLDKIQILVTLFLTLYAHKYVMVQQLNTMDMTQIEYVVILGYVCMFVQALFVFLGSEYILGSAITETMNWVVQISMALIVIVLIVY